MSAACQSPRRMDFFPITTKAMNVPGFWKAFKGRSRSKRKKAGESYPPLRESPQGCPSEEGRLDETERGGYELAELPGQASQAGSAKLLKEGDDQRNPDEPA